MAVRPSLQEYSHMKVDLGIAFRPAARATTSSKTRSMTWLRRDLPSSFRMRALRKAWLAGIILAPGKRLLPTRVELLRLC